MLESYSKHATLINNCYPVKEGEAKPKSSELSYLVFYASSRPVKLTKVGLFLEKKVKYDVYKGRHQSNKISLEIIKALIEACHRDLNLFSKNVVKIIDMVLDTKDISMIDSACQVFVVFTKYHEGSTLGVDSELTKDYELLLKKFADFCNYRSTDDTLTLKMRYIGQRGLQAAARSSALQASNYKSQVELIISPLINTLSTSKNPANALAQSPDEDMDNQQSATQNETLNVHSVDILAAKTTSLLLKRSNAVGVKLVLGPLFAFMDSHKLWWPPQFGVSMMELALDSLQPQYRYLLISEVLQQLELLSHNNKMTVDVNKFACLVSMLDTMLNANVPLVGVSVLEVLNSLFNYLVRSVKDFKAFTLVETNNINNREATSMEFTIQNGLVHSIGGLASQTYYLNQLNDIAGYVISKMKVGHHHPKDSTQTAEEESDGAMDGLPAQEYRSIALHCLNAVITTSSSTNESEGNDDEYGKSSTMIEPTAPVFSNIISLDAWFSALGLLTDPCQETRVEFANTLVHYFESTCAEEEATIDIYPKHTMNQHGDVMLVNALHQAIVDWVQLPNIKAEDIHAMYHILTALTKKFGADETIKAVPLIFKVQDLVQFSTTSIQGTARQNAIAALVIEWLMMTGRFYRIDSLIHYADELREGRIQSNQYSAIFMDSNSTRWDNNQPTTTMTTSSSSSVHSKNDVASIDKLDSSIINRETSLEADTINIIPVDKFVDRPTVIDILSKDGPLRDEEDTEGTELENKLKAIWGNESHIALSATVTTAAGHHDRSFRIRTSRNLSDLKAKLATSWALSDVSHIDPDTNKKQMIRVENLKEALNGGLLAAASAASAATANNTTGIAFTNKADELPSDINTLLQALSQQGSTNSPPL
ncbi:hypothetical protein BDF20DRAFT_860519 [Mycotypha africana]|uniref:uncharacterized protein n=1 Tax=Mycotypha africana TaxID=64632 RepID=UPI0022FFF944|nr:uncharacterized protein BDF20DRAFT_860519 [Mycotypha africana]KAI8984553.1 hypothetical protein BDF20DRAFT_860519 [Mycotypha africana]